MKLGALQAQILEAWRALGPNPRSLARSRSAQIREAQFRFVRFIWFTRFRLVRFSRFARFRFVRFSRFARFRFGAIPRFGRFRFADLRDSCDSYVCSVRPDSGSSRFGSHGSESVHGHSEYKCCPHGSGAGGWTTRVPGLRCPIYILCSTNHIESHSILWIFLIL